MSLNQAAQGRRARSVCIVTDKPVRLQEKITRKLDARPVIVSLGSAILKISELPTGEIVIEIEPP
jgi:hypothetical protein